MKNVCSAVWMWILGTNGTSYSTDDKKASVAFKLHYFIENNPFFFFISGYLVGGGGRVTQALVRLYFLYSFIIMTAVGYF